MDREKAMKFSTLAALALALSSLGALAQDSRNGANYPSDAEPDPASEVVDKTQRMVFGELDVNGDGLVSRNEALGTEPLLLVFDRLDQDDDEHLSAEEISEWEAMNKIESKR
jgi:hypothetical protein